MSSQESQNQDKTTEEAAVEKRRQFIKGAAAATPVILTLASPSVFGVECLSQQMSGNASQTPGSCVLGKSISYWSGIAKETNPAFPSPYNTGNPKFNDGDAFTSATRSSVGNPLPTISSKLKDILANYAAGVEPNASYATWVAALMNTRFTSINYIFTYTQLLDFWLYDAPPPGYTDKISFIRSTLES